MAGNRNSPDVGERMEWQLDQIRQAVMLLAVLAALTVIGVVVLALAGTGSG